MNWDHAEWKLTNVAIGNTSWEAVCNLPEPKHVAFPERRSYENHRLLCKAVNGKVTVIRSKQFQARFIKMFESTIPKSLLSGVKSK